MSALEAAKVLLGPNRYDELHSIVERAIEAEIDTRARVVGRYSTSQQAMAADCWSRCRLEERQKAASWLVRDEL